MFNRNFKCFAQTLHLCPYHFTNGALPNLIFRPAAFCCAHLRPLWELLWVSIVVYYIKKMVESNHSVSLARNTHDYLPNRENPGAKKETYPKGST